MVSCFHKYFAISKVYSNFSMSSFYDSFLRLKHAKVKRFVCSLKLYLPHNLCITTNEYDKLHMSHFSVYIFFTFLILLYCCPKDGDTETKYKRTGTQCWVINLLSKVDFTFSCLFVTKDENFTRLCVNKWLWPLICDNHANVHTFAVPDVQGNWNPAW